MHEGVKVKPKSETSRYVRCQIHRTFFKESWRSWSVAKPRGREARWAADNKGGRVGLPKPIVMMSQMADTKLRGCDFPAWFKSCFGSILTYCVLIVPLGNGEVSSKPVNIACPPQSAEITVKKLPQVLTCLLVLNSVTTVKIIGSFAIGLNVFCLMRWSWTCGVRGGIASLKCRMHLRRSCLSTCFPPGSWFGGLFNLMGVEP